MSEALKEVDEDLNADPIYEAELAAKRAYNTARDKYNIEKKKIIAAAERDYRVGIENLRNTRKAAIAHAENEYKASQQRMARERDNIIREATLEYETRRNELKEARDQAMSAVSGIQVFHIPAENREDAK